jgi:hypothetical protein
MCTFVGHFDGEVSIPILNIDDDRYSYLDLVDDITTLPINVGLKDVGLSIFSVKSPHIHSKKEIFTYFSMVPFLYML